MVLRPSIQTNIRSNLSLISPTGPGVIAIMGTAQWGPFDALQTLSSFNDGLNAFQDDSIVDTNLTLIKGLDLMYRNGAGTVYAMRVDDGSAATSSITLKAGTTSVITVYGFYKGTYGNNVSVTVTANGTGRDVMITDGNAVENYTNSGNGYTSNLVLVAAINAASALTIATCLVNTYLLDTATATNMTGGLNGSAPSASNYTTAFDNYLDTQVFNILVVPGTTADSFHSTMVAKLNTRELNEDKFSVFIGGVALNESIATMTARTAGGKRLSVVTPSIAYTNRISGITGFLDGSYLSCAYAGVVAANYPEISPTHKLVSTEGIYATTTGKRYYNNGEQEQILSARIVPMSLISGSEMCVRGVTRNVDITEVWFEQNIVDIVDQVEYDLLNMLNGFIGDPNLPRVRNVMAKNCDGILETAKRNETIEAYQPSIVSLGVSPDTVNVAITIRPTFSINFITLNLTIDAVSS